ncbi:GH12210 [Drosophila grimshawi]|uniref:GH12210 n=2 Tax=Drosophila grimshawi TaxID=7222 RepID=B4JJP4_DROGR|nr:GH12210 [Drosophila grimshawi]
MTDEQLQEWHTAVLTEAQRENYVNHNLEIVRHYRNEAISRAPAFDLERNAIDAAIARHGLCVSNAVGNEHSEGGAGHEEMQPPPMRRPRMEHSLLPLPPPPPPPPPPQDMSENEAGGPSTSSGHYVALAHIFSDAYTARAEPTVAAIEHGSINGSINGIVSALGGMSGSTHSVHNSSGRNNNRQLEDAELNDVAITETIDSLGLRRT